MSTLLAAINSGEQIQYIFFWNGYLSNWFPAEFEVDGINYPTLEHYFMAQKAKAFGDMKIYNQILTSKGPSEAKKLGRIVHEFDELIWDPLRKNIMITANLEKFSQNPHLEYDLLATDDAVLVEASPYDKIWGIGMGEYDPDVNDPTKWKGLNLLGFCLMEVRRRLLLNLEG